VAETVSASAKLGATEALKLAKAARVVTVAKGAKLVSFSMTKDAYDDETLLKHMLGPTGNLRAPTIVYGSSLLVGFNEGAYQDALL